MKKFLFLLCWFCQTLVLAQQYNFTSYSLEQGLTQSEVFSIAQDAQGTLWVATHDGVISRFDGKRFYPLTMPSFMQSATVNKIIFDKAGIMWIGTNKGLFQYDGMTFRGVKELGEKFARKSILQLDMDQEGNIWVIVAISQKPKILAPCLWDGKQFTDLSELLKKEGINDFLGWGRSRNGEIFIGRSKGIVYQYKNNRLDTVFTERHKGEDLNRFQKRSFCLIDNQKQVWVWIDNNGKSELLRISATDSETYNFSDVTFDWVRNPCLEDKKGNLWIKIAGGIMRLNPKTREITPFTKQNGLETADLTCIFEDREGTIWFGTQGKGLIRFAGERFVHFNRKDGMASDLVWRIFEDSKQRVWFSATPTASFWDGKKITNFFHTPEMAVQYTGSFAETPDGSIWIPTGSKGLVEYKDDKLIPFGEKKWEKMDHNIGFFAQLPSKRVMTMNGWSLNIYSPEYKLLHHLDTNSIPRKYFGAGYATEDQEKNIWYYNYDAGIFRFDGKKIEQMDTVGAIMGIEDRWGRRWNAGFNNGFWYSDKDGKRTWVTTKDGLSSNITYSVLMDKKGQIWAGTQNGLDRIIFDEKGNIVKIKNYGKAEGFTGVETNGWAIREDSKGNIWVGHINGVTRYNPNEDQPNPNPPAIQFQQLKLFLKETNWADSALVQYHKGVEKWSGLPRNLVLPYQQNHLTFDFFGTNYRSPEKTRYQWRLSPIESDWSIASDRTEAVYANLAPQNYTFMVRACNEDGVWSEPILYEFTITPPIWQTWWARVLGVSLLFGFAFTGVRFRIKQIEGQKARLEKIVEVRTAEVVQQKNEILAKNTVLEQQKEEIISQNDQINHQNKEILEKNEELVVALEMIDKKNKDITASINYAKRIQEAILPFESRIEKAFSEYFIFFQPRDIVSGDFYWFVERQNKKFIAAIDCTGHGIPGAFMSMVGYTLLNQIVGDRQILDVEVILAEMHKGIRHALKQRATENRDGMDMAICMIDDEKKLLHYAGAKNPLYYVQNGEIHIIKADRFPIGGVQFEWETERVFTKHTIDISQKTTFYLFTDGFQDQFGENTKQKFMSKNFRELLWKNSAMPMPEQRQALQNTMKTWIGNGRQLDDILVIGVRV